MPSNAFKRKSSGIRSPVFLIPAAAVSAAIIGWSIFWFIASRKTEQMLTAWVEREAATGRTWTCPERKIGGYPFELEISCVNPAFDGEFFGQKMAGTLKGFRATSPLMRPESVIASFEPPFSAKGVDGALNLTLRWESLTLDLEGRPDALTRVSLSGEQVNAEGTLAGEPVAATLPDVRAAAIEAMDRHDGAYNVVLSTNGAILPALNHLSGSNLPWDVLTESIVTQIDFLSTGLLGARMESWRNAGGRVEVKRVRVASGNMRLDARGALKLDGEHRIEGRLDTGFSGLGPILETLGIDPAIAAAGTFLTNFLGRRQDDDGTPKLPIPVTFADGRLSVGPVRTSIRLPPLY
ncbi:DUF2125 domain-containing protein [Methylocapsa palsarum]|uniref:DUF2125 domain-containing protein n=1 Tax=Methylocapsa palsarum TaxID=1612308 RepID=A0A1I4AEI5_9HYPH|nr:DUF2125 domain-containing protein [Methylocapsa palsarum]SFK54129.1 hypothetical protein SAMN05444581_1108 [Methylocapsa palsarum]